jgi:hypothetical protein
MSDQRAAAPRAGQASLVPWPGSPKESNRDALHFAAWPLDIQYPVQSRISRHNCPRSSRTCCFLLPPWTVNLSDVGPHVVRWPSRTRPGPLRNIGGQRSPPFSPLLAWRSMALRDSV